MIRFLLLGIGLFSYVKPQGLKTCATNQVCVPNTSGGPNPESTPSPIPSRECITDPDCPKGQICTEEQKCRDGCRTSDDCGDHPCSCSEECTEDVDPCQWCDTLSSVDGICSPGCADNRDCFGSCNACNGQHMCNEGCGLRLDTLTMTTKSCDGCEGTNKENGTQIVIIGDDFDPIFQCIVENLDHDDRVDYGAGITQLFESSPNGELGGCSSAYLNGYDITMFTLTWNGKGSWAPSEFTLTFTDTSRTVTCPYAGASLETGNSVSLECKRNW